MLMRILLESWGIPPAAGRNVGCRGLEALFVAILEIESRGSLIFSSFSSRFSWSSHSLRLSLPLA